MITVKSMIHALQTGVYDDVLSCLYALDGIQASLDRARDRAIRVVKHFSEQFEFSEHCALFSGPGRTEIGGNHTDHQHGHALCGSVDLDMLGCAAPNGRDVIRIQSEGYPLLEVDMDSLLPREEEKNTTTALIRGMAAKIQELGYPLAGFDAYVTSNVLSGSGLSSSAAYETLVGNMLNHFFCGGALNAVEIAKIGQYAENIHFDKPCGLLDQMGSSVGGAVAIDFADPTNPVVEQVDYDFAQSGHALCIVDTGSNHGDLTDDYADITREMGAVAAHFQKKVLREVLEGEFYKNFLALRKKCGDRAVLRAMHFYEDDRRAVLETQALKAGDFDRFLSLVNQSGLSSELLLQNVWSPAAPQAQAVSIALNVGRRLLEGTGAIRVHGGGFGGTIQAFVPYEMLDDFKTGIERTLGEGKCHILRIRPQGGCVVAE
mgnify:CR=1 FL=1